MNERKKSSQPESLIQFSVVSFRFVCLNIARNESFRMMIMRTNYPLEVLTPIEDSVYGFERCPSVFAVHS